MAAAGPVHRRRYRQRQRAEQQLDAYPRWEIDARSLAGWGYVAAAAGLALWLLRKRIGHGPLAGALYFALTLGPVLGFVDYGYMQFRSWLRTRLPLPRAAADGLKHQTNVEQYGPYVAPPRQLCQAPA